jgi:primary-amine oxidase
MGLGRFANSLEPRTDAPGNAVFFDAMLANDEGSPEELPRAMALFERDGGVLWKHRDGVSGRNETRRARELVLSYITTVGNYDYGFNWVFHQDGTLEMEVLLTGIMQAKGVPMGAPAPDGHGGESYAHPVGDNLAAVHHQHFFNFRLDLDVDGSAGNSVMELNAEAVPPGPENPYHNAFTMKETRFRTEQQAQRPLDLAASRKWKVINTSVKNALGLPVGYMLIPGENAVPYAASDSWIRQRAGFTNAHLWVTAYDPTQMNAAGEYPNQSRGGEGLPAWTRANRSIENQDIVLWYTMGITHLARPEEWPVMPVHRAGFRLVPSGFFARNPALDLPKPD